MKTIKSDIVLLVEASERGDLVIMGSVSNAKKREQNHRLSNYFWNSFPEYNGTLQEHEAEEAVELINEELKSISIDDRKRVVYFPFGMVSDGSEVNLLPITQHIGLKLLLVDEHHGGGEYEKYICAEHFVIDEQTCEQDVDALIEFLKACGIS